jgi:phosphoglycerate dehydrogenase-like enzyme
MALSSRYPQLLCILTRFLVEMRAATAIRIARIMLNEVPTRDLHQFKTTVWIGRWRSGSVKRRGCTLFRKTTGIVGEGSLGRMS